jgi:hypothetical protein
MGLFPLSPSLKNISSYAPPLSMLGATKDDDPYAAYARIAEGRTVEGKEIVTLAQLKDEVTKHVYKRAYVVETAEDRWMISKWHDVVVRRFAGQHIKEHAETLEVRSIAPQKTPEDLVVMLDLLRDYLAGLKEPYPRYVAYKLQGVDAEAHLEKNKRYHDANAVLADGDAAHIAQAFREFVVAAGASKVVDRLQRLRSYLPQQICEKLAPHGHWDASQCHSVK